MCLASVIVVAKNEEKNISTCLESILNQNFPKEKYEVIVVDGGSTDKTQEIVKKYPVKLIIDKYGTLGHQRNTGVKNAAGKYVAFTDADCIAESSWLKYLVEAMKKSSKEIAGICGPNLVMKNDPEFAQIVGYSQETFFGSGGSPQASNSKKALPDVISIPNCNAIYKREIIASEKYDDNLIVGEDAELNFRLRKKGYKFAYLPDAIVWHHRVSNYKTFVLKMFAYGEAMGKITRKHRDITRWYAFLPPTAIIAFPPYILTKMFFKISYLDILVIIILTLYLVGLLISTIQVYGKFKGIKFLLTFLLLPTQHFMYGLGFLKGFFMHISKVGPGTIQTQS